MSTIQTRLLKGKDNFDLQAIKVNGADYKDKWGVIAVTITSYNWNSAASVTFPQMGTLDIRPPRFNTPNDTPIVDMANMDNTDHGGTPVSVGTVYYFAVNNGVVGPAAFAQPDGTWDLLHIKFQQSKDNAFTAGVQVTVTYSVAFTDLTPSPTSNPSSTGSATLAIDNTTLSAKKVLTVAGASLGTDSGYISHHLISMDVSNIDVPSDAPEGAEPGDSVPVFAVVNTPTSPGFGSSANLAMHAVSKTPGTLTYYQRLMIFAVNSGKIDGNGSNSQTDTAFASYAEYNLSKVAEWPCDDWVSAAVAFKTVISVA